MEPTFFLLLRIAPKLVRANIIGILRPEFWRAIIFAIIPSFLVQFWTLDLRVFIQNSGSTKWAAPDSKHMPGCSKSVFWIVEMHTLMQKKIWTKNIFSSWRFLILKILIFWKKIWFFQKSNILRFFKNRKIPKFSIFEKSDFFFRKSKKSKSKIFKMKKYFSFRFFFASKYASLLSKKPI